MSAVSREPESTVRLIERARAGDELALGQLFARHLRPLRRWASGRLPKWARSIADTDDLVQDTLLQTFKRIEAFEPRHAGALHAYLRQAVLNRIRDELRRKGRRPDVTCRTLNRSLRLRGRFSMATPSIGHPSNRAAPILNCWAS